MVAYQALCHASGSTARPGCCEDTRPRRRAAAVIACVLTALLVSGCSYIQRQIKGSEGHLSKETVKPAPDNVPPPARISTFVPEPKPAVKPPTYSVEIGRAHV